MQKLILFILLLMTKGSFAQSNLSYYISAAKQNSPLLFDSKNQSEINGLEAERLKAFYTKPQIGLTANYLFAPIISTENNHVSFEPNPNGADHYFGYDLAASNGGTYQGLITFTQPLFNAGRYEAYAVQTNVLKQINQNNVKLTEHDIEKLVTDQYILCLLDKKQMQFVDTMLLLLRDQTDIVKKLVENSILKQSDLTLLNIEYQNNLGFQTTYKATYRRDVMDLNVLCGINDTTYILLDELTLTPSGPVTATSGYLEKYKLDSMNVLGAQKVFETKYKPTFNFYSNAGLNAVYAPTIPNRLGLSAGLSLTWNFFDGNQKSITRKKTDLQLKSVSFYRNNFLLQNNVRKNKILTELQSYNDRKSIAENQLTEYTSLLSSYKKEILQGQLSVLSYITTLKNMTTVKRDYFILETNRLLLINAYNYWNW